MPANAMHAPRPNFRAPEHLAPGLSGNARSPKKNQAFQADEGRRRRRHSFLRLANFWILPSLP